MKIKKTKSEMVIYSIVFVFFVIYTILIVYPFVWTFFASLKGQMEYMGNRFGLPKEWRFDNYALAWTELSARGSNMISMLWNSIWYSVGSSILMILSSVMLAYPVAKYKFPGRGIIYGTAIFSMMIPIFGNLPATYMLYMDLGLYDSPLLLITNASGFGFNFIVFYATFKSIPWDYAEAGFLDGAGHVGVCFKLMLPQVISPIMALFIMSTMGMWNDYYGPILFLPSYLTIPAGLYQYQMEATRQLNYPVLYAGILMSMIPVLVLYLVMQNKMLSLTIAGGLKG